jgi:hypothetical protein
MDEFVTIGIGEAKKKRTKTMLKKVLGSKVGKRES